MGNYKQRRRRKLVGGPSIMRVFGASYRFKEEAKQEREQRRKGQSNGRKAGLQVSTERSVHAISVPFGGMNKRR